MKGRTLKDTTTFAFAERTGMHGGSNTLDFLNCWFALPLCGLCAYFDGKDISATRNNTVGDLVFV
jgi:hypothetical protein